MNVLRKLFTAFKGAANEMGESIVDANGILIFEQEIREAKEQLKTAKESEVSLVAKKNRAEASIEELNKQVSDRESNAAQALEKGEESLAIEVAQRIVELEQEIAEQSTLLETLTKSCKDIREQISTAESEIRDMENNLAQIKATESVQKAQEKIHSGITSGNSRVASAKESLERIKEKQRNFEDRLEAERELDSAGNLDKKLAEAGISTNQSSAESVLERIKAKSQ